MKTEPDLEESDIDVCSEVTDIINDVDNSFNYIIKLGKQYVKGIRKI
jgi:hypothetical protein